MKKLQRAATATAANVKGKLLSHTNSDFAMQDVPSDLIQQQSDLGGVGPVPSNISTSSQLSNRRSTGLKTTQSSLSVNSGSIAEKDATIDPSLFTVPPEVVALPAGERLEALDNRIAEIKWRLETEEIILDRLNKLNLQERSAKYVKEVGGQKAAVRANVEKLNVSLAEHGRMRDEAIISQERGNLAADLRDSRLKRQELETKIKELQSQVDQQQELLGDYKTQSDAGRAKLNHHVISLNAQIDELTQENIKLERRLAEIEDGSQTCAEHAETISGLRAELQDALAELDRATADKAALDTQCQALQARVASLESSESNHESASRELSEARLQLAALSAKVALVETLQSQNERLAQSEGMKDERILHLTRELEAAKQSGAETAALNETIADLRRELNEKNGIIKEQHGTMESLRRTIQADEGDVQKELACKAQELEDARTHSLRLDTELAEAREGTAKLARELDQLKNELARAQQDIRAGNEKADGWLEERQAKDKQINELTITLREFMAVKDKEMCELSAQRQREQQEAVAVKERELARITEEKAALQAEVDKMSNTSETQARKQRDMQTRMKELEANLRRELSNSQDLNTKLIKTLQEKADLIAKLEEMEEQREIIARQLAEKPKRRGLFTSFSQTRLNE